MDFEGIIKEVSPVMQGISAKGNPWAKQVCVIETRDTQRQRQDSLAFEVFGADRINAFGIRVGDVITVQLNFEGEIGQYQSKKDGSTCYTTRTTPSAWGILRGGVPVRVQREVAQPKPTAPVYQQAQQPQQYAQHPQPQQPQHQGAFQNPFQATPF